MEEKIEKNVQDFLEKCAEDIGRHAKCDFEDNRFNECIELEMESPIEHILYIALKTVQELNYIEDGEPHFTPNNTPVVQGLVISPQQKIGIYRCDFEVGFYTRNSTREWGKAVVVECDSQKFHERTEKERRYEKTRDRHLTKAGYKVFHYTGSEIIERPLEIAKEILEFVTEQTDLRISAEELWQEDE